MDWLIKLRELNDWVIPLVSFVLLILADIIWVLAQVNKQVKLEKFFTEHGYKRVVLDMDNQYEELRYGWRKETETSIITVDDRRLYRYTMKEIKQRYS